MRRAPHGHRSSPGRDKARIAAARAAIVAAEWHAMTLNITVAARWMMTQSSDFRLTRSGVPLSDAAQKQVVLHYREWAGVVCYTGVAS